MSPCSCRPSNAGSGRELVLDYVVERKRLDDLVRARVRERKKKKVAWMEQAHKSTTTMIVELSSPSSVSLSFAPFSRWASRQAALWMGVSTSKRPASWLPASSTPFTWWRTTARSTTRNWMPTRCMRPWPALRLRLGNIAKGKRVSDDERPVGCLTPLSVCTGRFLCQAHGQSSGNHRLHCAHDPLHQGHGHGRRALPLGPRFEESNE
jgi:hypothetical protein